MIDVLWRKRLCETSQDQKQEMEQNVGRVRTTIAIENDVMISVRQHANALRESIGAANPARARAGMASTGKSKIRSGIRLLSVNAGAKGATMEEAKRLLDALE